MIDVISMLCQKFPAAFFQFEERRKPLARGVHKEIALAMPTLTKVQIRGALHFYTNNEGYCRACRDGAARVNLMGHEVMSSPRPTPITRWRASRRSWHGGKSRKQRGRPRRAQLEPDALSADAFKHKSMESKS
jgi:sRNA-binding protein